MSVEQIISRIKELEIITQDLTNKYCLTGDMKYQAELEPLEDELCDLYMNNAEIINQHIGF